MNITYFDECEKNKRNYFLKKREVIEIEKDIVSGIVYSQFHTKIGPTAIAWMPSTLPIQIREYVSLKSIGILVGEHGSIPKSLAIIPFPSVNLKGLVKCFEIEDATHRGGAIDNSITLLFDEADDVVFYKYIDNFDKIFEETVKKIMKVGKSDKKQTLEELERFNVNIHSLLEELHSAETSDQETESFPMVESQEEELSYRYKIIVCGDPSVGKTSTVLRFTDKAFRRTYIPTIGVNISEKQIRLKKIKITFIIWDIAGQSKFQMTRKYFYKGGRAQLLVFDVTRPETFQNIPKWYQDIKTHLGKDIQGLIIANKCDLVEERKVSDEEISKLSKDLGLEFFESSALSGENVEEAFSRLGEMLTSGESR